MAHEHIFVVEDEPKISGLLRDYLIQEGFTVTCLDRGDEVVSKVKGEQPALILLDIMMPGKDGTQVCREIRKFSNIPILMLTAKVEEIDRIIGLELGADDYICKPFSPREVIARVKAVLRRTYTSPDMTQLISGPLSLNEETHQVTVDGHPLKLTPSEFGLLKIMMANPNRVFSRSELLDRVQGYQFEGYDRTIDSHIKNLRKKIARRLPEQDIILTVYGVGYQFSPPQ
jgi:two-component system response regulator BaeR